MLFVYVCVVFFVCVSVSMCVSVWFFGLCFVVCFFTCVECFYVSVLFVILMFVCLGVWVFRCLCSVCCIFVYLFV